MTAKANFNVGTCMDKNSSAMPSSLRDITKMHPPMFFGSKVNEDPYEFLDKCYNIFYAMRVGSNEKVIKLTPYQFKDVGQTWHTQ